MYFANKNIMLSRYYGLGFRAVLVVIIIIIIFRNFFVITMIRQRSTDVPKASESINFKYKDFKCFQFPKNVTQPIVLLEDVMDSPRQPTPGKSIFFIETSCAKDGLINLKPR